TAANSFLIGGAYDTYEETLKNRLFTGYLNYNKVLPYLKSNLVLTVGHDYQYWDATRPPITYYNDREEVRSTAIARDQRHTLMSIYGMLNYSYDIRYYLTSMVRRVGKSPFSFDL